MRTKIRSLFAVIIIGALAACGDDPAAARPGELEALARTGMVGVQAEIRDQRGPRWSSAGVARLDPREPLAPRSRFRIGSTTKAFVATVALQLVQEGKLTLDDTVDKWLPGLLAGHDGRITLRQLLQHTSGLPDYVEDQEALLAAVTSPAELHALLLRSWTPGQLVALALAHPPSFAPGAGWSYSNTGYVVVGLLIERATGKRWDQQVSERIIAPLALADTYAPGANPFIAGPHARGYLAWPGPGDLIDVTELNPTALDAEGALISSTADLARFFTALVRGELLAPATLAQMMTTTPIDDGQSGIGYGLGLMRFPLACGGYWTHPGDVLGYHVRGGVDPRGERAVVLSLTGAGDFEDAADAFVTAALCP